MNYILIPTIILLAGCRPRKPIQKGCDIEKTKKKKIENECFKNEYKETYIPGNAYQKGHVRYWNDRKKVECNSICVTKQYREKYIPGTKTSPGFVKCWTETVEVPCYKDPDEKIME